MAWSTEHDLIPFGFTSAGMAGWVVLADIGLHFIDPAAAFAYNKHFAKQFLGYFYGRAVKK